MVPPKRPNEARNQALVKKAISAAEAAAASDADFVRLLRSNYFAQHPDALAAARGSHGGAAAIGGIRAVGGIRDSDVDPNQSVFDDPRYQKHARALAERTRKNVRIIGGRNTTATAFPDCVAVGSANRWGCSGTLIAPNVVLSAGHCAKVATRVYFGTDVRKKGSVVKVARKIQHPDYKTAKQNDLLLLILEKPVKVKPRRLAPTATISKATEGRAVGFGHIDFEGSFGYGTKREVDVPIVTASCTGKVNGKSDTSAYGCDRELEFVAGKPMLNRDSCSGDSGGPLYVQSNGAWLLAGATSRATKASIRTCGDGGVYVRVDRYREWIEKSAKVKLK